MFKSICGILSKVAVVRRMSFILQRFCNCQKLLWRTTAWVPEEPRKHNVIEVWAYDLDHAPRVLVCGRSKDQNTTPI